MTTADMFLSTRMVVGEAEVQVINRDGAVLLGARGQTDKDAIKRMLTFVDAAIAERRP